MNTAKLISITPDPEKTICYCARVSNPKNQNSDNIEKLIQYCLKQGHVSIFEHASLTVEIETSLAIATQIIRHKSFCFQMWSQRYQNINEIGDLIPVPDFRSQDHKNRQNSIDDISEEIKEGFAADFKIICNTILEFYNHMIEKGVAKECARFILPQATKTRLYMTGNCRSWIHYIELRSGHGTQLEHKLVAQDCKDIFCEQFPTVAKALKWTSITQ